MSWIISFKTLVWGGASEKKVCREKDIEGEIQIKKKAEELENDMDRV